MMNLESDPENFELDHVGINVPNLDQAVDFFTEAFGAKEIFRIDRFGDFENGALERLGAVREAEVELAMLEIGAGRLELLRWWSPNQTGATFKSSDVGASHIAIKVANVAQSLERLRRSEGVRVLGEPVTFETGATPGLTNAFAITPWGALIELVHWGE